MKKWLGAVVLIVLALLVAAWLTVDSSVAVKDVRQAETIVVGQETGRRLVHGISIRCYGWVDGEATVSLLREGKPYKSESLKGKVDFEWGGDWYAETAEIRYEPVEVRSGELTFRYRFYSRVK